MVSFAVRARLRQTAEAQGELQDDRFVELIFQAAVETLKGILDKLTITECAAFEKERRTDFTSATYFSSDATQTVFKKSNHPPQPTVFGRQYRREKACFVHFLDKNSV